MDYVVQVTTRLMTYVPIIIRMGAATLLISEISWDAENKVVYFGWKHVEVTDHLMVNLSANRIMLKY
jgi:hypothetical protein